MANVLPPPSNHSHRCVVLNAVQAFMCMPCAHNHSHSLSVRNAVFVSVRKQTCCFRLCANSHAFSPNSLVRFTVRAITPFFLDRASFHAMFASVRELSRRFFQPRVRPLSRYCANYRAVFLSLCELSRRVRLCVRNITPFSFQCANKHAVFPLCANCQFAFLYELSRHFSLTGRASMPILLQCANIHAVFPA